jgi:hypothetical protein
MIEPLRTVHRRAFVALALVLLATLLAGLGARRSRPQLGSDDSKVPASARLLRKADTSWQRHTIQTDFYSDARDAHDFYVVLHPAQKLNEPDLLLYWTPSQPEGNTLPPESRLLGSFASGKNFSLYLGGERAGHLLLYSGAHQAVVDVAKVEKLP